MSCAAGVGSNVIVWRLRVYECEYGLVEDAATTLKPLQTRKARMRYTRQGQGKESAPLQ